MTDDHRHSRSKAHDGNNATRQEWLINTLYALRGHFRDHAPSEPHNLQEIGNLASEGNILHCIDSRLDEKSDLNLARGEYFASTSPGGVVPSLKGNHVEQKLHSRIQLGYPVMSAPKARNIIIMGHTDCGANLELYKALLSDAHPKDGTKAAWMLPMAPKSLKDALKRAKANGANVQDMLRVVEQTTVLTSMKNLYDYRFDNIAVKELVNEGKLHIIGAIRDLGVDEHGKHPLLVFDPKYKEFRKIEMLYGEMFPGNNERRADVIEERMKRDTPMHDGVFVPVHSLEVTQGAKTRTVAEINVSDISAGIKAEIDKIKGMGAER
jgi:carbonic anhydrase